MNLRLPPLAWVAIAAGASAVIRFLVALQVRAPVFYPDEYLSTDFARNIANGSFGSIRGGSFTNTYTSYFVPVVQSPFWLLDDVNASVRLSQALGAIAFSAAAFPAYALSRRLGVSANGSLDGGTPRARDPCGSIHCHSAGRAVRVSTLPRRSAGGRRRDCEADAGASPGCTRRGGGHLLCRRSAVSLLPARLRDLVVGLRLAFALRPSPGGSLSLRGSQRRRWHSCS